MLKSIVAGRNEDVAGSAGSVGWTPAMRWALASLSLSMLLSALGTSIANVGLPTLAQAFDASFQEVQWIVLAYLLAITTLIVSAGRLGDITGRRRLLLAGIILFTAASVLCGIAPTLWLLIAARAAQGLGAAIMMAAPSPCAARAAIRSQSVGATPHRTEAAVNREIPQSSSRLRPVTSPSRPTLTIRVVMARR